MTKEKALRIQAEHIAFYSQYLPDLGKYVAEATRADMLEDDVDYPVYEINQYIPRGFAIEQILNKYNKKVRFDHGR